MKVIRLAGIDGKCNPTYVKVLGLRSLVEVGWKVGSGKARNQEFQIRQNHYVNIVPMP